MKKLWLGALKSAVGSASSLIISLPLVDPTKFSLHRLGGWEHIAEVIAAVVVVGEARYWSQWANGGSNGSQTPTGSTGA